MKCTSLKDLNRVKSSFHLEVYKFREPVEIRIFQGNLFPQGWCNFTAKEMVKKITKSRNVLHISEKRTYNWYSAPHPPKTEPQGISLSTSTTSFFVSAPGANTPPVLFGPSRTVYHLTYSRYASILVKKKKKELKLFSNLLPYADSAS